MNEFDGRIVQISISAGGVPKHEIPSAQVTPLGIAGDRHKHPQYHGGPLKALLLVSAEDLQELREAGYPVFPGALGENVTIEGVDFRSLRDGQQLRLGPVTVEITRPRSPCYQLDVYNPPGIAGRIQDRVYDAQVKARDASSPRWGKAGFYCRVLDPGEIRKGDPVLVLAIPA
jgi:MOSC domain-containing protein YiiM